MPRQDGAEAGAPKDNSGYIALGNEHLIHTFFSPILTAIEQLKPHDRDQTWVVATVVYYFFTHLSTLTVHCESEFADSIQSATSVPLLCAARSLGYTINRHLVSFTRDRSDGVKKIEPVTLSPVYPSKLLVVLLFNLILLYTLLRLLQRN